MYFNETYHSYSLTGLHDTDDLFNIMGSKVKSQTTS